MVKQAHWLLRNRKSLSEHEQIHLNEVLAANAPLMSGYEMKEQLKGLWNASDAWQWRSQWKQWLQHAKWDIALQRFSKVLKRCDCVRGRVRCVDGGRLT